ncbi:hypothetical protein STEG23_003728 [Scotinomys teguina]
MIQGFLRPSSMAVLSFAPSLPVESSFQGSAAFTSALAGSPLISEFQEDSARSHFQMNCSMRILSNNMTSEFCKLKDHNEQEKVG